MSHVLVDTSVLLPATLSPGGMARKLWVLLALQHAFDDPAGRTT